MGKMTWIAAGILVLACNAAARETPKAEVSAGYSYLRLGGSGGLNQDGGSFSVAGNANRWLGIVRDFGFYHASPFGLGLNTAHSWWDRVFGALEEQGHALCASQTATGFRFIFI